jgi:2-hydroxy-6-oxonona-2,4-dienedioate hydrolase
MHARLRKPSAEGGPNLVFVHGLLVSSRYFEPTARQLWNDFSVWAPDMPGFGKSENPRQTLDVIGLADALRRWLDELELRDVVLVANSFGCQYAVDLVARDPSRAIGLVLLGPTVDPARRNAFLQAGRFAMNVPFERLSMGAVLMRDLLDAGLIRVAITYRHMLRDRIEDKLPFVTVPTIVVRGERDTIVRQDWAERATAPVPGAELEVIARAAHTINFNSPDQVARIVRTFVETL